MESVEQQPSLRRLRAALEGNQFRLYYQPQLEHRTGRIVGAEALLRWQDPAGTVHEPGYFLQALESTGLIVSVGEWAFKQAAEDCRRWQRLGLPRLKLALNVSPVQLLACGADSLSHLVRAMRCVCEPQVEISGLHLLSSTKRLVTSLHVLRSAGADITVQDFGVDNTIHHRLWAMPVDTLKIHRSFIRRLMTDVEADDELAGMLALARAFRLASVAEGVESVDQLKRLAQLHCERSQGFLHSPPVSAERFEWLLRGDFYPRSASAIPRTGRLAYDA